MNDSDSKEWIAIGTRVLEMEGQSILACARRLQQPQFANAFLKALEHFERSLKQGGKLVITGVGKSGKIAQKIAATLSSTGSLAVFLHPTEGLHGDLGLVAPQDAVLALSYTGNTDELVRLLPSLQSLRVPLIGMGGNPDSKLAQRCDVWLDASVEQEACPHNLAPTTSTTLALALGDALAVTLMKIRGFDARAFAQNHPGGSLGKRLHLKVSDLMHTGEALPMVSPQTGMEDVIVISSQKKLGTALVVDQGKLLGIITDGDLRRALSRKSAFFGLKAEDVMTRDPITASPSLMAEDALRLMEEGNKKITALPVVDSEKRVAGIIHIHDLLHSF